MLSAYIALVAIGAIPILVRSREALDYSAERELVRNHRVAAADLRTPRLAWALAVGLRSKSDYAGRYLDRNIHAGDPVKLEHLKDKPEPVAAEGTEIYAWFLKESEKHWSEILDVGWSVDLCADNCPVMGAPVLALDCSGQAAGTCALILQLTSEQRNTLRAYPGKQKLSVVVSSVNHGGRK